MNDHASRLAGALRLLSFSLVAATVALPCLALDAVEEACEKATRAGTTVVEIDGVYYQCEVVVITPNGPDPEPDPDFPGSSGGSSGPGRGPGDEPGGDPPGGGGGTDPGAVCKACETLKLAGLGAAERESLACKLSGYWYAESSCSGFLSGSPERCDGTRVRVPNEPLFDVGGANGVYDCNKLAVAIGQGTGHATRTTCSGTVIDRCIDECMVGIPDSSETITVGPTDIPGVGFGFESSVSVPGKEGILRGCKAVQERIAREAARDYLDCLLENECPISRSTRAGLGRTGLSLAALPSLELASEPHFSAAALSRHAALNWFYSLAGQTRMSESTRRALRAKLVESTRAYQEQLALDHRELAAPDRPRGRAAGAGASRAPGKRSDRVLPGVVPRRTLATIEQDFLAFAHRNLGSREYRVLVAFWPGGHMVFGSRAFVN